ncbi:SDR family NAD(P)-dependent oxidoreductase [Histidinibacterium aquaticum]|uniref:SDR family NAD(P)-dependent oxidoreductase n=1 Tax=Histidinibacterium aquaticum TaxID=2613962 RepID=A0A5J5GQ78_9RHOB|nr:SDR family NAD(P)-dependent oxidoreductase [Histidinibacterium aquaticum]KAA9010401.1 SDR family NAD(P)-dependent oxidoreductase [Histidinibacterium aquaticum]
MSRALVIGASGGIGAAISSELEGRDYEVTRLSRRENGLDVTDPASVESHLGNLDGPFDLIVISTGILAPEGAGPEKALGQIEPDTMARTFAVNAVGPALVLAHAERLLPREGRSAVGVLSARVGSIGDNRIGGWYSYRASKAALNQILRGAAIEIGRKRKEAAVVALHPGTVETPFTADYPGHSKVSAEEAAANLVTVLEGLTPKATGRFYAYDGQEIPW